MNKKITILYVLKMLMTSTKEHPISQSLIAKAITKIGYKCDRKTIARDINTLIEYGYQIEKVNGIGFYLKSLELKRKNNISSLDY